MEEFLVALTIFGTIFGVVYLYFSTRHKERMALIEKGESADLFVTSKRKTAIPLYAIILINFGLLGVGIGMGILLGEGLHLAGMNQDYSMPSSIFMCIGLSLLTGFTITRKMDQKYREQDLS
ncbi:MAG: hypothetical protein K9I85_14560 [Saprospiraceae bacterium]|nr:hypothetical protein [Saprospiraceae bacterium]